MYGCATHRRADTEGIYSGQLVKTNIATTRTSTPPPLPFYDFRRLEPPVLLLLTCSPAACRCSGRGEFAGPGIDVSSGSVKKNAFYVYRSVLPDPGLHVFRSIVLFILSRRLPPHSYIIIAWMLRGVRRVV